MTFSQEMRVMQFFISTGPQVGQAIFFVILACVFVLLVTERLRPDLVAMLAILALYFTHILSAEESLAGFQSEPAIVIAGVFVLGAGFRYTGLADTLGRWIGEMAGAGLARIWAVLMVSTALLSAFTHHVTITAIMLPVTMELSQKRDVPPSKLLLPLTIASSLGTTITIIGAPSFLVASALLRQAGRPGLGVFSIAPIGVVLTIAGTAFILLFGRFLLPTRQGGDDPIARHKLDDYFTEVAILPDSPLLGQTVKEVEADEKRKLRVVGWLRRGRRLRAPFGKRPIKEGDALLVRASPEDLIAIREESGLELRPVAEYESDAPATDGEAEEVADRIIQAVIAPGSDLVNRTIASVDFRRRYGVLVIALWRQHGWLQQELSQTRLKPGDVLVLQGDADALSRVARDGQFLMTTPFFGEALRQRKAILAGAIMLLTVLAAALSWATLGIAVLAGAVAMVLVGCVTPRQGYRSIDVRMFVFLAGAIPLGIAMKKSGAADLLAHTLQRVVGGWNEIVILLALYLFVGVIVQFMGSDSATTALFGPVAIALAQALGHAPEAYVVTVAMAAVTAVFTPLGHHNLLVYTAGGYRFNDFFRVGAPLTLVLALIVTFMARLLWH